MLDDFSEAIAWIATSVAVVAGLYFTKNPLCLWAFAFPMFL